MSTATEPGTPSPLPQVQGGRTLARTLSLGARCALRVWPLAVLLALPSLAMSYAFGTSASNPSSVSSLLQIPVGYLANAVLTAAALPSLVRWFHDPLEVLGPRAPDLRGRLAPTLVAALASSILAILTGPVLLTRAFADVAHMSGLAVCALVVAVFVSLWLQLRFMLVVAAATIETCDPWTAVRRSWLLTGGRAALLTMVGMSCVLGGFWVLAIGVLATFGDSDVVTNRPWIAMLIGLVMAPFFLALSAVLYHDFRRRLDHVDSERIAAEAGPL